MATYKAVICTTVRELNRDHWEAVCGMRSNPYLDLRFITAVENSMSSPGKYWFVLFYDQDNEPVACTCFSRYTVDGSVLAPPRMQKWIQNTRRWTFDGYFRFRVLLCGLPVSTGEHQIAFVPGTDVEALIADIDEIACRLARKEWCAFISVKELDPDWTDTLRPLTKRGYRLADSVVTYTLRNEFTSFQEYYETRSKRTRANMRKYMKKFDDAGLRWVHLKGSEGVDKVFTDDVHQLYMAVFNRAEVKFEILPAEFFREIARQLPEESRFTFIYKEDRIVAFCLGLYSPEMHYMLLCGIDYELNPQTDLYFNMLYRGLEFAIQDHTPLIRVGASADEFKRRLGTFPKRLYIYIKSPWMLGKWLLGAAFKALFTVTPADQFDVPPAADEPERVPQEARESAPASGA